MKSGRKEGVSDFDLTEKAKGTSLAVQWLRIHASTTGELGLAPGWGPTTCRAQPKKEEKKPTVFLTPLKIQLVKNPLAMHETPVQFLGQKIHWRKDRPPTPLFLGFPCDSTGKEAVKLLCCVQLFATPWTVAYKAPLSMEFSRPEY